MFQSLFNISNAYIQFNIIIYPMKCSIYTGIQENSNKIKALKDRAAQTKTKRPLKKRQVNEIQNENPLKQFSSKQCCKIVMSEKVSNDLPKYKKEFQYSSILTQKSEQNIIVGKPTQTKIQENIVGVKNKQKINQSQKKMRKLKEKKELLSQLKEKLQKSLKQGQKLRIKYFEKFYPSNFQILNHSQVNNRSNNMNNTSFGCNNSYLIEQQKMENEIYQKQQVIDSKQDQISKGNSKEILKGMRF